MAVAFKLFPQLGTQVMHADALIPKALRVIIAFFLEKGSARVHLVLDAGALRRTRPHLLLPL